MSDGPYIKEAEAFKRVIAQEVSRLIGKGKLYGLSEDDVHHLLREHLALRSSNEAPINHFRLNFEDLANDATRNAGALRNSRG